MGDTIKSIAEVNVVNTTAPTLIYEPSELNIEVYQAGQAELPLAESMLTTPDDLLALHVPGKAFQYYLFFHFSRVQGSPESSLLFYLKIAVILSCSFQVPFSVNTIIQR